jgi:hypothetical protein
VASRVKGLHLHKGVGARAVEAVKNQIRRVGEVSACGLHECTHSGVMTWAAVDDDMGGP